MIVQAYVFVAGAFYLPRVGNLYYALTHSPEPLTDEFSHALSWEAATDRFVAAGSISAAEAEAMEEALSSAAAGIDVRLIHNCFIFQFVLLCASNILSHSIFYSTRLISHHWLQMRSRGNCFHAPFREPGRGIVVLDRSYPKKYPKLMYCQRMFS